MRSKKSDCDVLFEGVESVANDLGSCFDTAFDERKSKANVIGSLFKLGASMTKLTVKAGVCAVKNTPKAVVAVANAKRELVDGIESGINQVQKEMKEDALEQKIKMLKQK